MPDAPPRPLMIVTDPDIPDLETRLDAAVAGGASWVEYRDKRASTEERVRWIVKFRSKHPDVLLLVNNDVMAAKQTGAGVHLSADAMPAAIAGGVVGEKTPIGRSLHWDGFQRGAYKEKGLGYALFGPVFPTQTHPGEPGAGLAALLQVCDAVARDRFWMMVLAIGGVTPENAADCIRAGAAGVAAMRGVLMAPDPARAAQAIVRMIRRER